MQRTVLGNSKNKDQAHQHNTGEILLDRDNTEENQGLD